MEKSQIGYFLWYIFWCAFGNHDFVRVPYVATTSYCKYCDEYKELPLIEWNDQMQNTVNKAVENLKKSFGNMNLSYKEATMALMHLSKAMSGHLVADTKGDYKIIPLE